MPKRRRKLSAELEKEISAIKKQVELISAIINDISDEDLQNDYRSGFDQALSTAVYLTKEYDSNGVTPASEAALTLYKEAISKFESEYEI